jgi:hypothetical protein
VADEDEFKDVGKYFGDGEYVELPTDLPDANWTVEGWFIWMSANGPLVEAEDGSWEIGRDENGRISYRIGGVDRRTAVEVTSLRRDSWSYVVLTKERSSAFLYLDGLVVDSWAAAPAAAGLSGPFSAMKNAIGFAADLAVYDRRLDEATITRHWDAGKGRV